MDREPPDTRVDDDAPDGARSRAEELEELQAARAELAQLLVHDLKNPLSGVVSNLEFLLRAARDKGGAVAPDELQALEDARGGARRLFALVEGLVQVEQADSGQLVAQRTSVRVRPLLEDVVGTSQRIAVEAGIAIDVVAPLDLEARIDPGLVSRALENLLANALRFALGGRVEVRARGARGGVELSVANTGTSVPSELRDHLFERYKPRRHGSAGLHLGLGLYLCRRVAEAHGGGIALVDDPGWAARFAMWLPS
jgi:signal transduction histidine kinase